MFASTGIRLICSIRTVAAMVFGSVAFAGRSATWSAKSASAANSDGERVHGVAADGGGYAGAVVHLEASMKDYVPAMWDTAPDAQVSVSLDIGIIPQAFEHGGQYVVSLQALPFKKLVDAQRIA